MRFIFEELVVTKPTVKTYLNSDTRFRSYDLKKKSHGTKCVQYRWRAALLFQIGRGFFSKLAIAGWHQRLIARHWTSDKSILLLKE